ncbi:hypothetical protein NL392_34185, partial [Klebsiella pneumoniae]|nr:hypothetical protein [Klebsiella pneumoniae]
EEASQKQKFQFASVLAKYEVTANGHHEQPDDRQNCTANHHNHYRVQILIDPFHSQLASGREERRDQDEQYTETWYRRV